MPASVEPASHLNGAITLPADKSISHRAAMFAALHDGNSPIRNFSAAADPHSTLKCLRGLGLSIQENGSTVIVEGVGRDGFSPPNQSLDCGNSGTTMRLLSGIVGGAGVACTLTGDESLSKRTMKRIIDPLSRMGIQIKARDNDFAPLQIRRDEPLRAMQFPLPIPSAQLKSCVLLAGLFGDDETEVIEYEISRDHTERLLQLPVEKKSAEKKIRSSRNCEIPNQSYAVPGDFSAAAFWLVAGAIHPDAKIKLPATGINPTRTGALDVLWQMGASITLENERAEGFEPIADLEVTTSTLQPIDITPEQVPNCIDEIPVILIAMLFADGTSTVQGAKELRHKETDRLHAMADVLKAAGADFDEHPDGFTIYGDPDFVPRAASFNSYHDHRIAMAAAVLALMSHNTSEIFHADCTAISYPSFWDDLSILTN